MGRIFETRKATMFARWDKMSKAFARVGKEITIAVKKGGPNPDSNPQLRRVLQNARAVNMPKDKVESAIKKAAGVDTAGYDEIMYEGYGPHGVAILVECATDNIVRTVANIRHIFTKGGGNMGSTNSVSFNFKHMGVFRLHPTGLDAEALELELIDAGLEELGETTGEKGEAQLMLRCGFADFGHLAKALEDKKITPISSELEFIPQTPMQLPEDQGHHVLKLVDSLEQDEDVQRVFHNLG